MYALWTKHKSARAGIAAAAAAAIPFVIGAGVFAIYLITLAPTVGTNDAGRFQIAAPLLGTGHPTGYPTFILFGKLFTYLPFGDVAYRVNLMAAVFGGIAAGLLCKVARQLGAGVISAAGAALLLAFTYTFWAQATFAEVYTMNAAFLLAVFALILRWREDDREWPLLLAAFLFGLGLGNNAGMVLLAPSYLVLLISPGWRRLSAGVLLRAAGLALLGLSVYLYIPIRGFAGAWNNHGDPVENWEDVWRLVSGARFQGEMGAPPLEMVENLRGFAEELFSQAMLPAGLAVGGFLLAGGLLGVISLLRHDVAAGLAALLGIGSTSLYALNYRIDDIAVYYIPAYLFLVLLSGVAMGDLGRRRLIYTPLIFVPLVFAGITLASNFSEVDRSDEFVQRERSEETLAKLPEESILYGKLPILPITYLVEVEGRREDVTLRWLDGAVQELHMAADVASGRPVYVVSDPDYERYLRRAESYAVLKEENGLIRLLPEEEG